MVQLFHRRGEPTPSTSSKHLAGFSDNGEFCWAANGPSLRMFATERPDEELCAWTFTNDLSVAAVHCTMDPSGTGNPQLLVVLGAGANTGSEVHLLSFNLSDREERTLVIWKGLRNSPTAAAILPPNLGGDGNCEGEVVFKVALGKQDGFCLIYTLEFDLQECIYLELLGCSPLVLEAIAPETLEPNLDVNAMMQDHSTLTIKTLTFLGQEVLVAGSLNGDIQVFKLSCGLPQHLVIRRPATEAQEGPALQFCLQTWTNPTGLGFWAVWPQRAHWLIVDISGGQSKNLPLALTSDRVVHFQNTVQAASALSCEFEEGTHPLLGVLVARPQGVLFLEAWDQHGEKIEDSPAGTTDEQTTVATTFWMDPSKFSLYGTCGPCGLEQRWKPCMTWAGLALTWAEDTHNNETLQICPINLHSQAHTLLDAMEKGGYRSLLTDGLAASCHEAGMVYHTEASAVGIKQTIEAVYETALNGNLAPLICMLILATEEGISGGYVLEEVGLVEKWAFAVLNRAVEDLESLDSTEGPIEMGMLKFWLQRLEGLRLVFQALLERRSKGAGEEESPTQDQEGQATPASRVGQVATALDKTEALVASCRIWQKLREAVKNYTGEILPVVGKVHQHRRNLREKFERDSMLFWGESEDTTLMHPRKQLLIEVLANRSAGVVQVPAPTPCALALHPYRMVAEKQGTWDQGAALALYALLDIWSCCLGEEAKDPTALIHWLDQISSSFGLEKNAAEAVFATWLVDNAPDIEDAVSAAVRSFLRPDVKLDLESDLHLGVTEALLDANHPAAALSLLKGKPPREWTPAFRRQHVRALLLADRPTEACAVQAVAPASVKADLFQQICWWHQKQGVLGNLLACPLEAIEFTVFTQFLQRENEKYMAKGVFLSPAVDLQIGLYLQSNEILHALLCHEEHVHWLKSNQPKTLEALNNLHLQKREALLTNYKKLLPQDQRQVLDAATAQGSIVLCSTLREMMSQCAPRPSEILKIVDARGRELRAQQRQQQQQQQRAAAAVGTPSRHSTSLTDQMGITQPLALTNLSGALPESPPPSMMRHPPSCSQPQGSSSSAFLRLPPSRPTYSSRPHYHPPASPDTYLASSDPSAPDTSQNEAKQFESMLALPEGSMLDTPEKRMPKQSTPYPKRNNFAEMSIDTPDLSSVRLGQSPSISSQQDSMQGFAPETLLSTPSLSSPSLPYSIPSKQLGASGLFPESAEKNTSMMSIQEDKATIFLPDASDGRIKTPSSKSLKKVRFEGTGT